MAVAGVGASGVAAPAVAFFVSAGGGAPSAREVAILAALLLAGLYAAGPWRGHTFHLAILVVAGWVFAVSFGNFGLEVFVFGGFGTVGEAVSTAGAASMVVAVIYLGVGSWLHDKGLEGMATPFLGVAAVALPVGAFAVARDLGDFGTGAVLLAVGAAVALVGARCRRGGTTWLGLGVAVYGLLTLCDAVSDRTSVTAVVVVLAGAGLVFAAPYAGALVGELAPETPAGGPPAPSVGNPDDGSRGIRALAPLPVPDAPPEAPSPWVPEAGRAADPAAGAWTGGGTFADPAAGAWTGGHAALEDAGNAGIALPPEAAGTAGIVPPPEAAGEPGAGPDEPAPAEGDLPPAPGPPRVRRPRTTRPPGSPRSPRSPPAGDATPGRSTTPRPPPAGDEPAP